MGKVIFLYGKKGRRQMGELTVLDVAEFFLTKECMQHKKLQKLCYYAQAWHKALYDKPLFADRFEAWVHGPVSPILFQKYRGYGWNYISKLDNTKYIDDNVVNFLENVFETYGGYTGEELEQLSHSELPWQSMREGLEEWEPSNNVIDVDSMGKYYKGVYDRSQSI